MTYSNQNIFGYQATQHFPYYQEKAIYQREKQVTEYLDSIADSRNNNQSQHDTLVALGTMIYNLREVYIFQDVNQNKFYNDNKYLEFVNRQLTAFKDRVLRNYQHYLNLAPSFAPQYLEQNITILHEISHGQYSPIKQLHLEHQPIYLTNHYGQTQATFFSTQQQQNLETMMFYRPGIWIPAPPPISLFSIASHDANHDPYNSHLPSLTESQRSSQDYSDKDRSSEQVFQAQEDKGQEIFGGGDLGDNEKGGYGDDQGRKSPVLAPAQVSVSAPAPIPAPAPVSSDQGGNAGGDNSDEFEGALDDILRNNPLWDNPFQEGGSSGDRSYSSPLLNQSTYGNHAQSINEPGTPLSSQPPQHSSNPVSGGEDLLRQVTKGRGLLRQTESPRFEEVERSGGDYSLPSPTFYFADEYTTNDKRDRRGQSIGEQNGLSTSPVLSEDQGEIDPVYEELLNQLQGHKFNLYPRIASLTEQGAEGAMEIASWDTDDRFSPIGQGSDDHDSELHEQGVAMGDGQGYADPLPGSQDGSGSGDKGSGSNDLFAVTGSSSPSQGTYTLGGAFGTVQGSLGGHGNPNQLGSEWSAMTSSQTGPKRMEVASGVTEPRSPREATVTGELVYPVTISSAPEKVWSESTNPAITSSGGSSRMKVPSDLRFPRAEASRRGVASADLVFVGQSQRDQSDGVQRDSIPANEARSTFKKLESMYPVPPKGGRIT